MTATDTGITGVIQIAISATDLEKSTVFYRDKLGLVHLFTSNGMAFFDCGGIRLLVGLHEAGKPEHYSSIVYFRTDDIERTAAMLIDRGVAFKDQPHLIAKLPGKDVWLAAFSDPDGNALALMSEVLTAA
ncbi:MAG: VOC family protein [Betaproteobacteria bacterium]|nr:VOC family protein [Betaproteobacteria bacterium]